MEGGKGQGESEPSGAASEASSGTDGRVGSSVLEEDRRGATSHRGLTSSLRTLGRLTWRQVAHTHRPQYDAGGKCRASSHEPPDHHASCVKSLSLDPEL